MSNWPRIDDERTLRRFAMSDAEFVALAERLAERIGGAPFTEEHLTRALGYPWHEPPSSGSFLLIDGVLARLPVDKGASALGDRPRHALVAIGSNADPVTLTEKLAGLEDPDDRSVLGIHGSLIDIEIGHSPHLAVYGSLPATIFRRTGATAQATLLMVTSEQLTALSRTEFNYLLTRLPPDHFVGPADHPVAIEMYAYISRHGVVTNESGAPVPLHRPDQRALLDRAARQTLGEASDAAELIRRTIESYPWAVREARPRLAELARPLDRSEWDLHPGH